MAKRESQGLQIALILTVMLAVLMAITTIVFWNMAKKGNAELASLRSENQTSQTRLRDTVDQNQALKEMLGYTADENIETVKEEFELAKQKFGANFPEENRNYRKLPEFMANTINDLHTKIAETDARLRELEQKNTNLIEEKNKLVAIEKDAHDKAAQEVLNLRAKFAADLKKLTDKMESWELADKKKLREKDPMAVLFGSISDCVPSYSIWVQPIHFESKLLLASMTSTRIIWPARKAKARLKSSASSTTIKRKRESSTTALLTQSHRMTSSIHRSGKLAIRSASHSPVSWISTMMVRPTAH